MTSQEQPSTCICGQADCQIPFGLCHCKCGGKTNIASVTSKTAIKGRPQRFIIGHQSGVRFPVEDAMPIKIDGKYCRFIRLGRRLIAIVNQERYAELVKLSWTVRRDRYTFYAHHYYREDGKKKSIGMHQMILRIVGSKEQRDHANGNGLDNRDDNLRPASSSQQRQNSKLSKINTSGCSGVSWDEKNQMWRVRIGVNGKEIWLGRHAEYGVAVRVRKEAELKYFGDFARKP